MLRSGRWELWFACLAIFASVPLWAVRDLPIQDLPQHLAAIRVIHDFGDPELAFGRFFELHLGRTQYLAYYLAASLLAYPLGVLTANKILLTAAIVGLPYAMRDLLARLERDERYALFAIPLAWNAHLMHGFVNFVAALPLMFVGLTQAVALRLEWSVKRAIGLGVLLLLTFYTHVIPFALLAFGVVIVALGGSSRDVLRRLAPLAPSAVASIIWLASSPAARTVVDPGGAKPTFESALKIWSELGRWLIDVLHSPWDERSLWAWFVLVAIAYVSGDRSAHASSLAARLGRRLAILTVLALVLYFVAPSSYGWIWPINARFSLIAALLLLVSLPAPRERLALPLFASASVLAAALSLQILLAFRSVERDELADLAPAIASIPPGQKVVGLVFEPTSKVVKHAPLVHAVALYQARRGGAVMFSFADYPHSPFSFKPGNRPEPLPPRWEWSPGFVQESQIAWFDWVLTHADPGVMSNLAGNGQFELAYDGRRWKVWKRRAPSD